MGLHVGAGAQGFGSSSIALEATSRELDGNSLQQGCKPAPMWNPHVFKGNIWPLSHSLLWALIQFSVKSWV